MNNPIEHKIRFKIALIYLVATAICVGMAGYLYKLRQNINAQRDNVEEYYHTLTQTNTLIFNINRAQAEINLYISTKDSTHFLRFQLILGEIEQIIDTIDLSSGHAYHDDILIEINRLLQEKGGIVSALQKQLDVKNPLGPAALRLKYFNPEAIKDSILVSATVRDTLIKTAPKTGFWKRLAHLFAPNKNPDTLVTVTVNTEKVDTVKLIPEEQQMLLMRISQAIEQAGIDFMNSIAAIEEQVSKLIITDQDISLQIASLLNELYLHTIRSTSEEIQKNELLIRKNTTFSIIGGIISLGLILIFVLLIINDVRKGQEARKALEQANIRTRQIMESRHKLLLSVSHDIKTPLSSILGYLELWRTENSSQIKELLSMQNSAKHILSLLTNLLGFSSLEQRSLQTTNTSLSFKELCEETAEMFEPLAQQKRLSFERHFGFDKKLIICSDILKIKQIVINLLSNAVKYTLSGGIRFYASYEKEHIRFSIIDTGAGIPKDQINTLFDPFFRVETNNGLAEGSGLGMYVVRGLVDLLGGKISISSTVGVGTQVDVSIPVKVVASQTESGPKKVIIIDDDTTTLTVLNTMLTKLGHSAVLCRTITDFSKIAPQLSSYDVVITDMEMGSISGKDMLRTIRETDTNIPVIIMTGRDDFSDTKATELGFNGYLPKPFTMSSLEHLIGNHTGISCEPELLEKMFAGDTETVREILEVFIRTSTEHVVLLYGALVEHDFPKAQALCHKMLPMFLQLGVTGEVIDILKQMDALREESPELIPEWEAAVETLIRQVRIVIGMVRDRYLQL